MNKSIKKIWLLTKNHGTAIGIYVAVVAIIVQTVAMYAEIKGGKETRVVLESIKDSLLDDKLSLSRPQQKQTPEITTSNLEERYAGCNIRGRSGRDVSSNIEIHAPKGFDIINYKEVPKKGSKNISTSRSYLLDPTFDADKFSAKCYGDGKIKKVLGVVVDHYNAWRVSDIILTLQKQ